MNEENSKLHNYVYSSEMVVLVKAANGYCQFLEDLGQVTGREFIVQSVRHLSDVYSAILRTGETEPLFESSPEPTVTEQDWAAVYQGISLLLGTHNEFIRQAEAGEFDRSDLVTHTISEDMADIYQELRDFTALYGRGLEEIMNDAAWELKERFIEHWGKKLLRAMAPLHDLFVQEVDPESGDIGSGECTVWTWEAFPATRQLRGSTSGSSASFPSFSGGPVMQFDHQQVRLEISQKIMLEGEGFQASLSMENTSAAPIEATARRTGTSARLPRRRHRRGWCWSASTASTGGCWTASSPRAGVRPSGA